MIFPSVKIMTPIEQLFLIEMYQEDNSRFILGECCDNDLVDILVDNDSKRPIGLFDNDDKSYLNDIDDNEDNTYTYDGDDYFTFDLSDAELDKEALL